MNELCFTQDFKKFLVKYYPLDVKKYYNELDEKIPIVDKKTKIVSMGSCFALNIAKFLKKNNYNYLTGEKYSKHLTSADWDMVYNTPCMRQIFQYSFETFSPIVRWWERKDKMDDPFRRGISYKKGLEENSFKEHVKASNKVLSSAEIIILTLGLIETWRDKRDLSTFWRCPPIELLDERIHEFHILDENECISDLEYIYGLLSKYNSKCKIILSVSPVPLRATFRNDVDCVTANVYSKSVLRNVAGKFSDKYENVFYFPSYEFVIYGFDNPYQERDNMHIKQDVIDEVMLLFKRRYKK